MLVNICLFFVVIESSVVFGNVVEKFALLFKQVHLHAARYHIITFRYDLVVSLCLCQQALKEVILFFRCVFSDNVLSHSKLPLFHSLSLLFGSIYKQKWVIQQNVFLILSNLSCSKIIEVFVSIKGAMGVR